jgi:c-di-GMP-binding flagellar brake protein YcgR
MHLYAEQLADILGALGNTRAPKRRAEKRSYFRIGARYRISLRHGAVPLEAWLRDVSASGIGMLLSSVSPPAPGATVTIELPRRDRTVVPIACVVRNASQCSAGTHQIGVSFVLPIDQVRETLALRRVVAKSA